MRTLTRLIVGSMGAVVALAACSASESFVGSGPAPEGGDATLADGGGTGPDDATPAPDGAATDAGADAADGGGPEAGAEAGTDAGPVVCTNEPPVGPFDLTKGVCTRDGFCQLSPMPLYDALYQSWAASNGDVWVSGRSVIARWNGTAWAGLAGLDFVDAPPIGGSGPDDVWFGSALHWDGATIHYAAHPVPGTATSLSFTSATDGWAVNGTTTAYHWDGADWTAMPTGAIVGANAVKAFAPNDVWVVGGPSARHWNGVAWEDPASPFPASVDAIAIGGAAPDDFWVTSLDKIVHHVAGTWTVVPTQGSRTIAARSTTEVYFAGQANLRRWDGTQLRTDNRPTSSCYQCGHCTSAAVTPAGEVFTTTMAPVPGATTACPIAGRGGTTQLHMSAVRQVVEYKGKPFVLGSGGGAGGTEPDGSPGPWSITAFDKAVGLSSSSPNDIWVSAYYDASTSYTSHFDGAAWTRATLPAQPTSAVGASSPTSAWVLLGKNAAYWDGATWTDKGQVDTTAPKAIWGSANDAWAVGYKGIFHWDGAMWTYVPGSPSNLVAIKGSSPTDVVAVRSASPSIMLYRLTPAGWTFIPGSQQSWNADTAVSMISTTDIWTGNTYLKSGQQSFLHWDGSCWHTLRTSSANIPDLVVAVGGSATKVWGYTFYNTLELAR